MSLRERIKAWAESGRHDMNRGAMFQQRFVWGSAMLAAAFGTTVSWWSLIPLGISAMFFWAAGAVGREAGAHRTKVDRIQEDLEDLANSALNERFDQEGAPQENRDRHFEIVSIRMWRCDETGLQARALAHRVHGAWYEVSIAADAASTDGLSVVVHNLAPGELDISEWGKISPCYTRRGETA